MKSTFLSILTIFIFLSCGKNDVDLSHVKNLNGNKISPIGHAGSGFFSLYPINSFESISHAVNLGMEGVEVDIQMTKDSVLVLYHDGTLESQTNLEGLIYEKNWSYVQNATYKEPVFTEYRIITLDQLFEHLKNAEDYDYFLDFKLIESQHSDSYVSTYVNALVKILDKHQMHDNVFVLFKLKPYLEKLKALRPQVKLVISGEFEDAFTTAKEMESHGILVRNDQVTHAQVQQAHDEEIWVSIFGLDTKDDNLEAIEKSPDFLVTDKLKHLAKVLKINKN